VAPDGSVVAKSLLSRGERQYLDDFVFDGSQFLFAYETDIGFFDYQTHARLVNPDLSLDPAPELALGGDFESIGLGFGGGNFLLVWTDGGNNLGWDLYGMRVATDGSFVDPSPFPVALAQGTQWNPRVAFDGTNFLTVWDDSRGGPYRLYGARVSPGGNTIDPGGIAVAYDPLQIEGAQVASNGGGQALVGYERLDPSGNQRVYTRLFQDVDLKLKNGDGCVTSVDCKSGFCVDHVCCKTACDSPCMACNVDGKGNCQTVTDPPQGDRPPCTDDGSGCGGTCDGVDPQCIYPPATQACRSASCQYGYATAAASCDGAGRCPRVQSACTPYVCGADACATQCSDDTACDANSYCLSGACVAKNLPGVPCVATRECASGVCSDGFCCSTGCPFDCSSCGVAGHEGECTPLPSPTPMPVGGRAPCTNGNSTCAGYCNGNYDCFYPVGNCQVECVGGEAATGYCFSGNCYQSICQPLDLAGALSDGGASEPQDLGLRDLAPSTTPTTTHPDLSTVSPDLARAHPGTLSGTSAAGGCGCHVAGRTNPPATTGLLVVVLVAIWRRRRKDTTLLRTKLPPC
jgi:MYXO-CTERM domain-containing protein